VSFVEEDNGIILTNAEEDDRVAKLKFVIY
jgi:hypothetical protein